MTAKVTRHTYEAAFKDQRRALASGDPDKLAAAHEVVLELAAKVPAVTDDELAAAVDLLTEAKEAGDVDAIKAQSDVVRTLRIQHRLHREHLGARSDGSSIAVEDELTGEND